MSSSGSKIQLVTLLSTLAMAPACFCATGPEIRFEHIGVEHGLSDNGVFAIHQDIKGFIWFGTSDGLNRYDGYHFTIYRHIPLDSQSISINNVPRIFEDRSGTLWIRGPDGNNLNRFDRTRERFTPCLPNTSVSSIYEDEHGTLWFATSGGGLFRYDRVNAKFVHHSLINDTLASICGNPGDDDRTLFVGTAHGVVTFDQREGTSARLQGGPSGAVTAMLGDRAGNVWIGTREGLYSFNCTTKICSHYPFGRQITWIPGDNDVQILYEDREGLLWIGLAGAGIAVFDPSTRKYRHFPHTGYQAGWRNEQAICEDRAGALWVVTPGRGLQKYDRRTGSFWTYLNDPRDAHSLSSNLVNCIYEDRSGTLWIGTRTVGLSKIDPARKAFHHYAVNASAQTGLTDNVVLGFAEDHSGMLWITTMDGLNKFDRSKEVFTHYRNDRKDPGSLSTNSTGAVLEDIGGSLWVGAGGNGLDRLDPSRKRFTRYMHDPRNPRSLGSNAVLSLCEDRTGGLWVGYASNDGPLDRIDLHSGAVTHFNANTQDSNSFSGGWVWAIYEDTHGYIWICTGGKGLNKFNRQTGSFTHYQQEPNNPYGLKSRSMRSFHEDGEGRLWVGTAAGLNKFDPSRGTFVHYTVREGLESDHIGAILLDDHGCLWMSTNRGISKFDPRTAVFRNYNEDDGVSFHQYYMQAGCRTRNGEMYFGGTNGFIRFHPDSIADNPYVPPIVITRFLISDTLARLDTVIAEKNVIGLSHDQNSFSFEFVSLNYTNSAKNQYAYKLEGFDKDWVQSGTRRYASYTNLDGGTYVFRVKGSNNDGVWNEQGASITLIITPPFSKTWWFITMVWVSIAGAGAGTVRYVEITKLRRRMRALEQQQALEKERVRISIDLHDELASNLTSIAMLSKILSDEEQRGEATLKRRPQLLERITTLSKESVHGIRDIIWAIDPTAETLASLLQRIRDMAVVACRDRNVGFTYEASGVGQLRAADLTPVERRHLWLLLKEAVHNALNHSGCKTIALVTSLQGETVSITLNDDGCGFDSSVVSGGKGLKTMRLRAQQIGSGLDIVTRPGGGTSVTIFVKGQNRLN